MYTFVDIKTLRTRIVGLMLIIGFLGGGLAFHEIFLERYHLWETKRVSGEIGKLIVRYQQQQTQRKEVLALLTSTKQPAGIVLGASTSDRAASIPALLYHGIVDKPNGTDVLRHDFEEQMVMLKKAGWQTVTLKSYLEFVKGEKQLPYKSFLLTFDDARKDSYYPVDPVLEQLGFNAVMYVIANNETHGNYHLWPEEIKELLSTSRWEVQSHSDEGHDYIEIDSNGSKGHYLTNLRWLSSENRLETPDEFRSRVTRDLLVAKSRLEELYSTSVYTVAYPFGDYGQVSVNYPDAFLVVPQVAQSIYDISFYQANRGDAFSSNVPGKSTFMQKRINVSAGVTVTDLIMHMENGIEKSSTYNDDFTRNRGWISGWGSTTFQNGFMHLGAEGLGTGGLTYLDGSQSWRNYEYTLKVSEVKGKTLSLVLRYNSNKDYVACDYSNDHVSIVKVEDKPIQVTYSVIELDLSKPTLYQAKIVGKSLSCGIDGRTVVSSGIDALSEMGGIGVKVWDPIDTEASAIVDEVSVNE